MNIKNAIKVPRVVINGVLLLDKPEWFSSNDALIKVKRLFNAKKAGHTGTLDPFATGLLPLCFGEATKFSQDLLDADKTYEALVHLGVTTTTGDTEGSILNTAAVDVTQEKINQVLNQFLGESTQIPPMHSALKQGGKPLYEYAREGIVLERQPRNITIHELSCLTYDAPYLKLKVKCSKGTYVRVLCEDIGAALGCGAHLAQLRRTAVGNLHLQDAHSLAYLEECDLPTRINLLAPVDTLLLSFESIILSDDLSTRFLHGQRLCLAKESIDVVKSNNKSRVRVYRQSDDCLLGTAHVEEYGVLAPERLVSLSM